MCFIQLIRSDFPGIAETFVRSLGEGFLTKRSFDNDLPSGGSFCLRFNQSLHDGFDSSTEASVAGHGHVVVEGVSVNLWFFNAEDKMCRVVPNAQGPAFHGIEGPKAKRPTRGVPCANRQEQVNAKSCVCPRHVRCLGFDGTNLAWHECFNAFGAGAYKLEVATKVAQSLRLKAR